MECICLVELSKKSQQEIEAQKKRQQDSGGDPGRERDRDINSNSSDFNFSEFVRLKNENRLLKTQLAGGVGGSIPQPGSIGMTRFKSPVLPSIHLSGGGGNNNNSSSNSGAAQCGGNGSRR